MPYCRKCGAKLEENARFCQVCGTPVAGATAPPYAPYRRARRQPHLVLVAVLISVLLLALALSALVFFPFNPVNFNQTNSVTAQPSVDHLNLDLSADVADINIIPQRVDGNLVQLNVSASGSTGLFGSADPIKVTFSNLTANNTVTVTSTVSRANELPLSFTVHVVCDVYVDPSAELNLTVHSSVGQIVMNAQEKMTIRALNLQTTTGAVEATLTRNVLVAGNVSATTTTGSVTFNWEQADAQGNVAVNLRSTTGTVNLYLTRTNRLSGNVTVDAGTTTGSVNLTMTLRDGVGAKVESQTTLGGITVDAPRFSGDKSPIQSNNYPAASNFLVNLRTTTGGINITGDYESGAVNS
jgi:hypothetical protein